MTQTAIETQPRDLTEARPQLLAEATDTPGRYRVQLINPGWGSSGHYSADVLAEAATRRVFPAGLHMYADHPTATDEAERPERSVRDLWAVLETDATVAPDGALVAEARVFTPYRALVEDMADAIGLSIRARGFAETGEAEGRQGTIITSLDEALSVDFVTAAGRGGRILELIESARVEPSEEIAEALPGDMTANDLRDALCSAVSDAYGGDERYAWVRDYTDEWVVFELDGDVEQRGTFRQAYTVDGNDVALDGDPVEVQVVTTYEPVANTESATPAGPPATPAAPTASAEESEMTNTPGADGTAPPAGTSRSVLEQEVREQRRQVAIMQAQTRARTVVAEALADAWLTPRVLARLTSELLEGERLPLVEADGRSTLDEQALRDAATAARDQAELEAGEILESAGVGRPRGLGALVPQAGNGPDLGQELEETFRSLGMSESAAKTAAKGR